MALFVVSQPALPQSPEAQVNRPLTVIGTVKAGSCPNGLTLRSDTGESYQLDPRRSAVRLGQRATFQGNLYRRVSLCLCVCVAVLPPAGADSLSPGSDAPPCNNMLLPGSIVRCQPQPATPEPVTPQPHQPAEDKSLLETRPTQRLPIGGVTEEAVDDYLAHYGKPPREAVRALINPTDDNIAAMAAREKQRQIVAAYVAQRWNELQQRESALPGKPALEAYTVLPFFIGVQLNAYLTPDCPACEAAVKVVKQLAAENPVADARLMVITDDERAALDTLLRLGALLPVSTLSPQQALANGLERVPVIEVIDTRTRKRRVIAGVPTLKALRETVIAFRKASQTVKESQR